MLPISANEAADLAAALANSDEILAGAYSQHGSLWDMAVTSGGDTSATTETVVSRITLYMVNTRDYILAFSASETEVPEAQFRYLAPGAPSRLLNVGDVGPTTVIDENFVAISVADRQRALIRTVVYDGHNTLGIIDPI